MYLEVKGTEQHDILRSILDKCYNQLPGLGEHVILLYRFLEVFSGFVLFNVVFYYCSAQL